MSFGLSIYPDSLLGLAVWGLVSYLLIAACTTLVNMLAPLVRFVRRVYERIGRRRAASPPVSFDFAV